MTINLRPISFHCSRRACEGLGAGLGGSFFAASCANAGSAAIPVANAKPANLRLISMVTLLNLAPATSGALLSSDGRTSEPFSAFEAHLSFGAVHLKL